MDVKTYMAERVEDQINWLGGKAGKNQRRYKSLRVLSLVAAVLIPLLTGVGKQFHWDVTVTLGALGAVVAVCQGLVALNRYHENWTEYRAASEALKRERLLFETGTAPYDGTDEDANFHHFVKMVETILSTEQQKWLAVRKEADKGSK